MDAPPARYVRTSDGFDIAYYVTGEGPPLVHMPHGWGSGRLMWRHYSDWIEGLAERFRLVTYDARGWGLSTRGLPAGLTPEDFARDLPAVIEAAGFEECILSALGSNGHTAVRYAVGHPDRVRALIWNNAQVTNEGWYWMTNLARDNWEMFHSAIAPPGLPMDQHQRFVEDARDYITRDDLLRLFTNIFAGSSVVEELPRLRVPTLLLFPRNHRGLRPEEGMKVASLVKDAHFVLIDGSHLYGDASQGLAAIDAFLADLPHGPELPNPCSLTPREAEVLELLAAGKTNDEIATELVISRNTVRRHVSNILDKTGSANRAQAGAYARDHGHRAVQ